MADAGVVAKLPLTYSAIDISTEEFQMTTFGERLKALRLERELSQETLARMAGMGSSAIRDYENNRKEPSFRFALMLARALGVDCRALAFDIPEPEPLPEPGKKRRVKK